MLFLFVVFFFFQAEDGIRDRDVTGVQTCALPICHDKDHSRGYDNDHCCGHDLGDIDPDSDMDTVPGLSCSTLRSEERRVGKEWRDRWGADNVKKKNGSSR